MDKIVARVAALGVPGLVLIIVMGGTGFAGAAAITTALAVLGGRFGMLGGIALLGILGLLTQATTEFGFDKIFKAVVMELYKKGETKESIIKKIEGYLISKSLKRKLKENLEKV